MKRKVLHIINSMLPGGAETLLANSLAPGGISEFTESHLAYFMAPSYLLDRLDKNVQVHFLDYKGTKDIFRLIRDIRRIIIDNKIDIIHSHLNPAGLYTHLACPSSIPQVHTLHTSYSMDKETTKFKLWTEKYFYFLKKRTNVILLSEFIREDFLQAIPFKGKAFVLNNFVPDEYFDLPQKVNISKEKQLKLIAIGSLKPLKNFEYLLEVFGHLADVNIRLDIYGGGDPSVYLSIIKERDLKVRMMGHSAKISAVITEYDAFIMPSKFEGFPLSVFEAMAAGLPLLLSDIPPLRSIVKEHAIYFDLEDPKATAGILRDIYNGRINTAAMSIDGKEYAAAVVKKEIYTNNLLSIYDQVADRK